MLWPGVPSGRTDTLGGCFDAADTHAAGAGCLCNSPVLFVSSLEHAKKSVRAVVRASIG